MNGLSHQKIITEYCKCKNDKKQVGNQIFSLAIAFFLFLGEKRDRNSI
jgi:hypothetical protein